MTGPLTGLKVFDLTRILAGPTCSQLLGDLGAEVIKIERPGDGDDTRKWGPPFFTQPDGAPGDASAYFLSANRNKKSVTLDIAAPEGQRLARDLAAQCDIFLENFKTGGLAKYGLDYAAIQAVKPDIIYCSLTGFGQTGPYAPRAGYDYLAQGMGGIMSLTGKPDGVPIRVGIGIADIMAGMYAANAILAALHHRSQSGQGQHLDVALLDSQVAWLSYEAQAYLMTGQNPRRQGAEHPQIVPYRELPSADGYFILAAGNDAQFRKFCDFAGVAALADDPRFQTNARRVKNRRPLYDEILPDITRQKTTQTWIDGLADLHVPAGPVNNLDQVFANPQVKARNMAVEMDYPPSASGKLNVVGNPIKFSRTPVEYRLAPPKVGEHSREVLQEQLGLSSEEIAALRDKGVI